MRERKQLEQGSMHGTGRNLNDIKGESNGKHN